MASRYWVRAFYTALTSDEAVAAVVEFCRRARAYGVLLLTHSFDTEPGLLTRDELQKRAARLKEIVPVFKEAGLEVHVNVMSTFGHGGPTVNTVSELGLEPMVDHLGNASESTPCPLDPNFLSYVGELYGHMSESGASALWVDDDVRYTGHATPGTGCFCDRHVRRASLKLGRTVTREELVENLDSDSGEPTPERMAWFEANDDSLREMALVIRVAVSQEDPDIDIGLMTIGYMAHAAEGRDTPRLLEMLCPDGARWFRPGPGFWNDERPLDVVRKSEDCYRQSILAGAKVRPVSEVENYPYSQATKSLHMLRFELTLNALAGFRDQSLNMFDAMAGVDGTDDGYDALLADLAPKLDAIADASEGMRRHGVGIAADERVGGHLAVSGGDRDTWSLQLARLGIPLGHPNSAPHFLSGAMASVVTDDELQAMSSEGLIVDGAAAARLVDAGRGDLIGLRAARRLDDSGYERLTDDELNGDVAKHIVGIRHSPPEGGLFGFEANSTAAQVLSHMLSMDGSFLGQGAVAVPAEGGGRIVVLPWSVPVTSAFTNRVRQTQMHGIVPWVSDGGLPATVSSPPNAYPIVWGSVDDTARLLAVANLSFDPVHEVQISISGTPWALDGLDDSGVWQAGEPLGPGEKLAVDVDPWDVVVCRLLKA